MVSLVVGMAAVLLGVVCVAGGVAISVVEAFRPDAPGAFPNVKDLAKLGKVIADVLREFGKLRAGAQLMIVGLVLFGVGIWVLDVRPL